jgi:hypothetical protein
MVQSAIGFSYSVRRVSPEVAYCDSSRPEYIKLLRDLTGIPTIGAIKTSKVELIQSVQRRFIKDLHTKKYGIYFLEGKTPVTIRQMESYRWKPGGNEEPIKEFDDTCDSLQYAISMMRRKLDFSGLGKFKAVKKRWN